MKAARKRIPWAERRVRTPGWLPFIPLTEPIQYWAGRKNLRLLESSGSLFTVLTSRDLKAGPRRYTSYYTSLYQMLDPADPYLYLSQEMHATAAGISYHLWAPKGLQDFTSKLVQSVDTAAEVWPLKEDYLAPERFRYRHVACAELRLAEHFMFPLLQATGDKFSVDAMSTLCAALSGLNDEEEIVVQFLLRPMPSYYQKLARLKYDNYERFGSRPQRFPENMQKLAQWARSTLLPVQALHHTVAAPIMVNVGRLKPKEDHDALKKIDEGQFFDMSVRILTAAKNTARAKECLTTVLASFAPMQHKNRWEATRKYNELPRYRIPFTKKHILPNDHADRFLKEMSQRRIPVFPTENYLTPAELANVLHYADASIPGVIRVASKKLPVPQAIDTYNSIEEAWAASAVVVGMSNYRGRIKYIGIRDRAVFSRHLYLVGATGSGKTTLLQFLSAQAVLLWGWGLIYYDVKGDALDKLMQFLPREKIRYVDLSNQINDTRRTKIEKVFAEYYVPFNMLRFPTMTDYALSEMIVGVFVRVFGSQNLMFKSQNLLRKALLAVLATDPQGTILEVYRMFTDEAYLNQTVTRLTENGKYPNVLGFWRDVFLQMSPKQRFNECQPIINKLEAIVEQEKPRYTFCQTENGLLWREILDNQECLLINLAQGSNTDESQRFFGTLFTAFIKRAAWSREDTPEELRPSVLFILDEFEKFAGNTADIEEMLALARSYGLCLCMAHQGTSQIKDAALLGQVLENTSINICMNVGDPTARALSGTFPGLDAEDLSGLAPHQAAIRVKKLSTQTFTMNTLPVETLPKKQTNIEGIKMEQYRKYYNRLADIEADINARYTLVAGEQKPTRRTGESGTRGRLTSKEAPAHGKTPASKPTTRRPSTAKEKNVAVQTSPSG